MSDCAVSQIKIGLSGISTGNLGNLYPLINEHIVDVVAILDPLEEYAFAAKTLCINARRYEQFDHFLSCDLDGVIVSTPNNLHVEMVTKCLERGIPVLCPRSLGRSAFETRSIINSAILNDRLLHVEMSYRFSEEMKMVKNKIAQNTIGDIFSVEAIFHSGLSPEYNWWHDKELSGGGCLLDSGTFLIDMILWLFSYPEVQNPTGKLYCKGKCINHIDSDVEDFAVVQFEFENDCTVQLKCSWNCHIGKEDKFTLLILGTQGGFKIRNMHGRMDTIVVEQLYKTKSFSIGESTCFKTKNAITNWVDNIINGNIRYDSEMELYMMTKTVIDSIYDNSIT